MPTWKITVDDSKFIYEQDDKSFPIRSMEMDTEYWNLKINLWDYLSKNWTDFYKELKNVSEIKDTHFSYVFPELMHSREKTTALLLYILSTTIVLHADDTSRNNDLYLQHVLKNYTSLVEGKYPDVFGYAKFGILVMSNESYLIDNIDDKKENQPISSISVKIPKSAFRLTRETTDGHYEFDGHVFVKPYTEIEPPEISITLNNNATSQLFKNWLEYNNFARTDIKGAALCLKLWKAIMIANRFMDADF